MKFTEYLTDLSEASLSYPAVKKYSHRVQTFIRKIQQGHSFELNDNREVTLEDTPEIIDALENDLAGFGGTPKYLFVVKHTGELLKMNQFKKTKEFGGVGAAKKGSDEATSNKTSLQEVGFLVWLDMLIMGVDSYEDYTPSKRMRCTTSISDVVNFLSSNPKWERAVREGASTVVRKFGNSLLGFNFHHDDALFKQIRSTGKTLSGLSNLDKWNPSDVYLVRNWAPVKTDIVAYNEYVDSSGDVIGISLKKGAKDALHGAIALNVIAKQFDVPKVKVNYSSLDQKAIAGITATVQKLKRHPMARKFYVHTNNTSGNSISGAVSSMNIKSKNFFKSMPPGIEVIANTGTHLENFLKFAITTAMSVSPKSCPHWKLEGSKLSYVPGLMNIEIMRVRIKLNGETDTIVDFTFNGKQMKLQLRSKGSLPQFILIKTAENPSDVIPLSDMTL